MIADVCTRIRSQLMFYIDNELKQEKKEELISHLNECEDCQNYFEKESDAKSKICEKLKDSYICRCDVKGLQSSITHKIQEIISTK